MPRVSRFVGFVMVVVLIAAGVYSLKSSHKTKGPEPVDPLLVCANPSFRAVDPGMTMSQVAAILGQPQRAHQNPVFVKRTPAEWARYQGVVDSTRAQIGPELVATKMKAADTDPAVKMQFDQLLVLQEILKGQVYTTWYYDTVPGWNGSIEIDFSDANKVLAMKCGYG